MATNAQMIALIAAGNVVVYRGRLCRVVGDVPTDAQIAQDVADYSAAYVVPNGLPPGGTNGQTLAADSTVATGTAWRDPKTIRLLTGAGPYAVLAADDVVLLPATPATSGVINLPATSTLPVNKLIYIKIQGRNSLTLTLTANVADTGGIDGAGTFAFTADSEAAVLVSDKTRAAWWVLSTHQALL